MMAMSEEARLQASERAITRWAEKKKRAEHEPPPPPPPPPPPLTPAPDAPEPQPLPAQPAETHDEYADLLRRFEELRSYVERMQVSQPNALSQTAQGTQSGPQFGNRGNLIGTFEKYLVDPSLYADPRDRLAQEDRLQRFAFKHNYLLDWNVDVTQYETKDGVNTKEPRFTLKLNRIMMDEDTGELTNQAYTVCQMIFHEDPQAALVVAREQGVEPSTLDQKTFLNEMRYLRMRDWLFEAFYPPRLSALKKKKEMVISNKLVQVFEINSENPQKMPFDQLKPTKGL